MEDKILGFNQRRFIELGLDAIDAIILRWTLDNTDLHFPEPRYVQIKYKDIIQALPTLGINTPQNIARRFDKMVNARLLLKKEVKGVGGSFIYFIISENFNSIL